LIAERNPTVCYNNDYGRDSVLRKGGKLKPAYHRS
jgi:hypothetical protein